MSSTTSARRAAATLVRDSAIRSAKLAALAAEVPDSSCTQRREPAANLLLVAVAGMRGAPAYAPMSITGLSGQDRASLQALGYVQ